MINEELYELSLPFRGRGKTVRVFVPEHSESELLPVIYMTDGQNLFDDGRPGQLGCWYVREAVREQRRKSGKAAVIVGIHNDEGHIQRARELTPRYLGEICFPENIPEEIRKMMIPDGEAFVRFVTDTVMPEIEKRFPVKTGRENTAFCGSSSGGLLAFFTVLSHPGIFCMGGVFSPAFHIYDTDDIIRWTRDVASDDSPYLIIYSGSGDRMEQDIRRSTETVAKAISGFYQEEKLNVIIRPEQSHHETAWAAVFKELLHMFLSK